MPAAAERAVHRDVAGCGPKTRHDFAHHDRSMSTCRGLASSDNLLDVGGVSLGVQLLVFVVERARILPWVTGSPLVLGCQRGQIVPPDDSAARFATSGVTRTESVNTNGFAVAGMCLV